MCYDHSKSWDCDWNFLHGAWNVFVSAELAEPGILVPWCTAAQRSYLRTLLYGTQSPCLFSESVKKLDPKCWCIYYRVTFPSSEIQEDIQRFLEDSIPSGDEKLSFFACSSLIAFSMILAAVLTMLHCSCSSVNSLQQRNKNAICGINADWSHV